MKFENTSLLLVTPIFALMRYISFTLNLVISSSVKTLNQLSFNLLLYQMFLCLVKDHKLVQTVPVYMAKF